MLDDSICGKIALAGIILTFSGANQAVSCQGVLACQEASRRMCRNLLFFEFNVNNALLALI